ncbi:MAG: hypothetical protein A2653_02815 [Candidatus Zambryskibacteria bacterium RIFCSPHIGHO2_01_FULL_43_25]|uniref:Serine protease n=1 Tax=Candidatus Zambryskibacteria bacterium RIFCSPLOWO2_01_FULL_45_21 TaxID=1802761 RepID=A0A1G2U077_9BACT|nr:MAG: hypothetical protein A2653_02815 [Candidatus Zambryskibacteria bacterium RIFCSPHIGHO2_01_FULL_43_25]OHB00917.1 MAG: hypothetical protein A3E94_00015 [Candidatus Zambryskibacteria bacterium RIFCSPHIGHO2_12_FULL_44_12b]OHB02945.1 MAG: hypothetical protein A3B14_00660 [Candidatus Zambryskibacteria bacterium RIFCSPLOWO2_01_FULL_45_21]
MEDLNKTQLVLLTLLISFVTSIATGIITVSLLQEVPAEITQTINRVVEKTVEKVVPEEGAGSGEVKEVTVVVKEEDRVIDAIAKNGESIVRVIANDPTTGLTTTSLGVLISKEGLIVTNRQDGLNTEGTFRTNFSEGTSFDLRILAYDDESNLAFFQTVKPTGLVLPAEPAILSQVAPQLGQSVVSIEGDSRNIVGVGRVIGLSSKDVDGKDFAVVIETDTVAKAPTFGGPLINLSGDVIGIHISKSEPNSNAFASVWAIKQAMSRHSI